MGGSLKRAAETCRSPLRRKCGREDIAVYIVFGGRILPICRRCWKEISRSDLEWGLGISEEELKARVEEIRRRLRGRKGGG